MPTGRSEFGAAVVNDQIYVMGGNITETAPLNLVNVYNPNLKTWSAVAPMPASRISLATVARDGKIYAIGGSATWANPVGENSVFVYDPKSDHWTTSLPMPTARRGCRAVSVDKLIYVLGGFDESGYTFASNEAFGFIIEKMFLPFVYR
jgi:N-acetylneuraminic acid mutarotase